MWECPPYPLETLATENVFYAAPVSTLEPGMRAMDYLKQPSL